MSHVSTRRGTSLALSLSAFAFVLLPAAVAAESEPSTKAQIEHDESTPGRPAGQQVRPSSPAPSHGVDATAWQLALSAALGALVTGGVVAGSRRVGRHGTAIAS